MSLQRLAVISAVSSHGFLKNRTVYYERQQNETNFNGGLHFQQNVNIFVGGASLSFVIMLVCVMCYCFNKSINKNSMALYRRHLMEATNNQNMDIYTVEQFYETEAYAPLCETQSAQSVLPPSYEDVMATEKAILKKYAKLCSPTCCEHSHLNGSSGADQTSSDNTSTVDDTHANTTIDGNAKTNTDPNMYDDNGNELNTSQASSHCCAHRNDSDVVSPASSIIEIECCCLDNCSIRCQENITANLCQSGNGDSHNTSNNNNNNFVSTDSGGEFDAMQNDVNNNTESNRTETGECQCSHRQSCARNEPVIELNALSDNGIIRMDMSKIIDRTGLPTYDAAIKLESFGYV